MTDGVSRGVEHYRVTHTWQNAFDLIRAQCLDRLLDSIQEAEAGDADGKRWPRSEPRDDKTAVLITI